MSSQKVRAFSSTVAPCVFRWSFEVTNLNFCGIRLNELTCWLPILADQPVGMAESDDIRSAIATLKESCETAPAVK